MKPKLVRDHKQPNPKEDEVKEVGVEAVDREVAMSTETNSSTNRQESPMIAIILPPILHLVNNKHHP